MSVICSILITIRVYLDYLIDIIFGLYYNSKRQYICKPTNPLLLESSTALAKKIREKKIKSEEIVQACINRIREVNSVLNAVVDTCFEAAIKEAKEVDDKISSGQVTDDNFAQKPFLGVPFTTKESTSCKGLKHTFGLICRKDIVAKDDADVIEMMKKAGAILIGVTNVPQLNMFSETGNTVYGVTNNPYNTTRYVGGSSGGEASIIAACGSPMGVGSDIGGSIRIPSFMCGLFGHKPSPDMTPTRGLTYRTGNEGATMVAAGPMVRYSEDLAPFLKVLIGSNASKLKLDENVNIKDLKVFYVTNYNNPFASSIRLEVRQLISKIVRHFSKSLATPPQKIDLPDIKYTRSLWRYWMSQESNSNFAKDLTNREGEVNVCCEIVKYAIGKSEFTAAALFNLINSWFPKVDEQWALKTTKAVKDEVLSKLGTNGVLLYPSGPWPARHHYTELLRPWNFNYFAIWNVLKLPVTQVPIGLSSDGLPLGIQVIAAPYQDHLCIAVAKELEKAFGGYVPPFEVKKSKSE